MEGGGESSFRTQLFDVLEGCLGAQAMDSLRRDTTARNRKKRRMAEGPQAQGAWYRKDLGDALRSLQERPEAPGTKRRETESALAALLIAHCTHAPRTDFLLSLLPPLQNAGLLDWTSLLELLLAACPPPPKPLENSGSGKQGGGAASSKQGGAASSGSQKTPSGGGVASPRSPTGWAASPRTGPPERLTGGFVAQMQLRAPSPKQKEFIEVPAPLLPAFRPSLCHVASLALDSQRPLKPLVCLTLLRLALAWINSAMEESSDDSGDEGRNEDDKMGGIRNMAADEADGSTDESVGECMKLIRRLTLDDNHLLPSYNLLDETLVLPDSIPSAEPLLGFLFDIHERRDQVVYYYTRTDCQIRSPTFATLRIPPFTLQGILGEPLKGPELAAAVPPHSREWERAMACLKQALRNSVSADWWRRVLVFAPQFHDRPVNPSAEFSSPMLTEALVLRTLELLRPYPDSTGELLDCAGWQEWCLFADLLFQIVRSGHVDFLSYLTQLSEQGGSNGPLRSPLLAWLFAQLIRLEPFIDILKGGSAPAKRRMLELLVRFAEAPSCQLSQAAHVATLLDWAPSFLVSRLSMTHKALLSNVPSSESVPFPAVSVAWQTDLRERLKEGDAWYQALEKGQLIHDFGALDDVTMGRLWYLSHAKSQETTAYYFRMLTAQGTFEVPGPAPGDPPLAALRETRPMPVGFLTGIAIQSLSRLSNHIEELIAKGHPGASVALMETYVRILLVSPQSLYRQLLESLLNKYKPGDPRMTTSILTILELINYRLLPFYRYHNKLRAVWGDLERILAALLTVPGQHRLYRLTENLCMSIAPSIHVNFSDIKRATKGAPTSETVNRLMVLNIAMVSKSRGLPTIHDMEHVQVAVKQLLLHSTHAWSEATLRFFPPALRELLKNRTDVRGRSVLADWQKVGKAALSAHGQLMTAAPDAAVAGYLKNVPPEFRRWACVALWALSEGRPENTNTASFARVLRDFTPEEISGNVFGLVDFILLSVMRSVQKGEQEATVLQRTASNLAHVLWVAELLPYDVTLLALADRDDQPQALSLLSLLLERPEILKRVHHYCSQQGPEDHWTRQDVPVRPEVKAALGTHYAGHERTPPLFDDLCLRILPVLPILVGRFVEHGRFDAAAALLTSYKPLLMYHHSKLMLVRDLLGYYHGTMPVKLVNTLLSLLDPQHYAFSETFTGYLKHPNNPEALLAPAHFLHLLTKVAHVLPSMGETLYNRMAQKPPRGSSSARRGGATPGGLTPPWHLTSVFARHQDCATQGQLLMATVEVELLAVPFPPERVARGLAAAALRPENLLQLEKTNRLPIAPRHMPGGASQSPLYRPGITPSAAQFAETCGIFLAQLPARFHIGFFEEVQCVVAAAPWFNGSIRGLAPEFGGNPSDLADRGRYQGWPFAAEANNASEEGTVTKSTQALGAVHAFGYAVPFEWLHSLCHVVNMQRPIRNVAQLRYCFKMLGPLVPVMAPSRPLFAKTLGLLFTILADVCGTASGLSAEEASEVSDLVDFVHHCVTLEGRYMTPGDRTAHTSTLKLCTHAVERLHPELQKLFKHLTLDPERGLFAAELALRSH